MLVFAAWNARRIGMMRKGMHISAGEYNLELLRRAIVGGDLAAWSELQQCLGEVVLGWLRCHPHKGMVCRYQSEETFVAQVLQRFWQATAGQQVTFETFAGALVSLRASLHAAILDTLRTSSRPEEVQLPTPTALREPQIGRA